MANQNLKPKKKQELKRKQKENNLKKSVGFIQLLHFPVMQKYVDSLLTELYKIIQR